MLYTVELWEMNADMIVVQQARTDTYYKKR